MDGVCPRCGEMCFDCWYRKDAQELEWFYIRDRQPEHESEIIQVYPPYEGHYSIWMTKYYQTCSWQELLDYYDRSEAPYPDFYWMYDKDFPFPEWKEF